MYYSLKIGRDFYDHSINTWDDWNLIPTSRPVIKPPERKVKTVDIPGADGILDLSESLTGYPLYERREGSLEFYYIPSEKFKTYQSLYSEILNTLAPSRKIDNYFTIELEDDKDGYYYKGSIWLSEENSNSDGSGTTITLDYSLDPYKYSLSGPYSTQIHVWDEKKTITIKPQYINYMPTFLRLNIQRNAHNGNFYGGGPDVTISGHPNIPENSPIVVKEKSDKIYYNLPMYVQGLKDLKFNKYVEDGFDIVINGTASVTLSFDRGRL